MAGTSTPGSGFRTGQSVYWKPSAKAPKIFRPHYGFLLKNNVTGFIEVTLGPIVSSAQGSLKFSGTIASTLGPIISAGVGNVGVSGTAASTLGPIISTASGNVGVSGTIASTLGPVVSNASGTLTFSGSIASTLGPIISAASGTFTASSAVTGTIASTLDPIVSTASGNIGVSGTSASTLGAILAALVGFLSFVGTSASTLGPIISTAVGTFTQTFTGTVASTLGEIISLASGMFTSNLILLDLSVISSKTARIYAGDTFSNYITNKSTFYNLFYVENFNSSGTLTLQGSIDSVTFFDLIAKTPSINQVCKLTTPSGSTANFTTIINPIWLKNIRYLRFKSNSVISGSLSCKIYCF